jgi:hypothetical protein
MVDAEPNIQPAQAQKRGVLYLLTEIEKANGEPSPEDIDLCKQAQEIIRQEYYNYNSSASITSALRAALEKANQLIFNHNSQVPPLERRGVGFTVGVVRGDEIYTAQLPPAKALLMHQGEARVLSGEEIVSTARTGTDGVARPRYQLVPSLGRHSEITPSFNRNKFEPGDLFIMLSGKFAESFDQFDLEYIVQDGESRNALYNLTEIARRKGVTDGYALAVGARQDAFATAPLPKRPPNRVDNPTVAMPNRPASKVDEATAFIKPETQRRVAENEQKQPTVPMRTAAPKPAVNPNDPLAPLTPKENSGTGNGWLNREQDEMNKPPFLRGRKVAEDAEGVAPAPNIPPAQPGADQKFSNQFAGMFRTPKHTTNEVKGLPHEPRPKAAYNPPPTAPHLNADFDENGAGWGDANGQAGGKRSFSFRSQTRSANPEAENYEPTTTNRRRRQPRRGVNLPGGRMLAVGGAIAGAFLIIILAFVLLRGGGGDATKAANLIKSAQQRQTLAQQVGATDPVRARTLLAEAQQDLDAARKEAPNQNQDDLRTTQNAIRLTLDNINKVTIPADVRLTLDLSAQGTGVNVRKGVISPKGDFIYLMDVGRGAIYSGDPLGGVKTILKSGDKYGGAIFGKPVAMLERPDGVLVLDESNGVWVYNRPANTWTFASLSGATSGVSTKNIAQSASYQGNIYLIMRDNGQILKWNAGQYNAPAEEWLSATATEQLKLDKGGGLSIDGTIYSIGADGKVHQLARQGAKGEIVKSFDLKGDKIFPPITSTVGINAGTLDFPYYFVVDNGRVLQFNKSDGALVQQLQARTGGKEFENLQDVLIDEPNRKIYLVGTQRVHVFNLPSPGQTITPTGNPASPGSGTNVTIITAGPTARP